MSEVCRSHLIPGELRMHVALFTHCFLEPTHFAIGQLLDAIADTTFSVFARRFAALSGGIGTRNVARRDLVTHAQYQPNPLLGCDLVHTIYDGDITFEAIEMAAHAHLPVIISFHGGFDTNAKIFDGRYRARTLDACRSATAITVVGQTDRMRLAQLGISDSVKILPVPVDPTLLPQKKKLPTRSLVVIARLIPKKGIDIALECLSLLPDFFTLTVVGDGELRSSLQHMAGAIGVADRVNWTGYQPLRSMLEILADSRILLHPARVSADGNADGTPQVILWAQALGVPVIATSTGSITDIVQDRYTGLVRSASAMDLARAVLELTSDEGLRTAVVAAGRKAVESRHQISDVAEHLRATYSSVRLGNNLSGAFQPHEITSASAAVVAEASQRLGVVPNDFRHVAKGGHGDIYVLLPQNGQPLALKIPAYDRHSEERWPVLEQKLAREWVVLNEAAGDGLPIPIHGAPGGRFLIRQFVIGEPLSRAVRYVTSGGRADLFRRVITLGRGLFARFHASSRGCFLLRDIKPQNIIVSTDGPLRLTLVDLGAVCSAKEVIARTWTQSRLGTGQWLHWAPEELLGMAEAINTGVDYFALGVTAYFALTGCWPYSNSVGGDPDDVWHRYTSEYASAVERLVMTAKTEGIEPDLTQLVVECIDPCIERRCCSLPNAAYDYFNARELLASEAFGL